MINIKKANITVFIMILINIFLSFSIGNFVKEEKTLILISQLSVILPFLVYVILTKQNLLKLIRFKKIDFITAILLVVLTFCMIPVFIFINSISMIYTNNVIQDVAVNLAGGNLLVGLLLMAVTPSIVEEVTYRGILYNTYKKAGVLKGLIISALLFGAIHMNFNQFIYATILGFIMALILEVTGSIISSMIVHFVFNGFSVVLVYLSAKLKSFMSSYGIDIVSEASTITDENIIKSIIQLAPMALVFSIISFFIFKSIAKRNNKLEYIKSIFKRDNKNKNEKVFDIFIILSIVICFIYALWLELIIKGIL